MLALLKPKEEKFFVLLRSLAEQAFRSAAYLKAFIDSASAAEKEAALKGMASVRADAKMTSYEVTRRLCQTFITPFDREDIQDLASDLYAIPKKMEKVAARISMYGMDQLHGDFSKQIDVIVQEAAATKEMVRALTSGRGTDDIMKQVAALQDLEHQGDDVRSQLLESLFREVSDARALILRKDVYDMLEKVIDRYRDAANIALQIVLKHS